MHKGTYFEKIYMKKLIIKWILTYTKVPPYNGLLIATGCYNMISVISFVGKRIIYSKGLLNMMHHRIYNIKEAPL